VVVETAGLKTSTDDPTASPVEARVVAYRPVEVLAVGRGLAGVSGIEEGAWVVTLGQHLLGSESGIAVGDGLEGSAEGSIRTVQARVRAVPWERVLELQNLQDEDLLEDFLAKQRVVAAALGAEIPASEEEVDRVLEAAAAKTEARER
jgi:hypothetical protein